MNIKKLNLLKSRISRIPRRFLNFPLGKKGILITLGTFFIVFVILSFVIVSYRYAKTQEKRFSELAVLDRTDDLFSSIEAAIKDSFDAGSGVDITLNTSNNSIKISESLNNTDMINFINNMTYFKNFIESNFEEVNLTISDYSLRLPSNIVYNHSDSGAGNITVSPLNAKRYTITLRSSVNITGISGGSEGNDVKIDYYDEYGVYHEGETYDTGSTITISLESGDGIQIKILDDKIVIWNKGKYGGASVEIIIEYSSEVDQVSLGDGLINVNLAGFGISKENEIVLT